MDSKWLYELQPLFSGSAEEQDEWEKNAIQEALKEAAACAPVEPFIPFALENTAFKTNKAAFFKKGPFAGSINFAQITRFLQKIEEAIRNLDRIFESDADNIYRKLEEFDLLSYVPPSFILLISAGQIPPQVEMDRAKEIAYKELMSRMGYKDG